MSAKKTGCGSQSLRVVVAVLAAALAVSSAGCATQRQVNPEFEYTTR
ncbi:hypothetical protein [Mycobacterium asiaticum]|nr:hypothetical protein [Mycobacterium asiaticum]